MGNSRTRKHVASKPKCIQTSYDFFFAIFLTCFSRKCSPQLLNFFNFPSASLHRRTWEAAGDLWRPAANNSNNKTKNAACSFKTKTDRQQHQRHFWHPNQPPSNPLLQTPSPEHPPHRPPPPTNARRQIQTISRRKNCGGDGGNHEEEYSAVKTGGSRRF